MNKPSLSSSSLARSAGPARSRRGRSTREALMDAAERLIAEKGFARLNVAEVARVADQRSRSATQYYFKSLEELARAVLERRGPSIRAKRAAMLRDLELAGRGHDIRAIVEAIVLPVTGLLGSSGAHFRSVAQLSAMNPADRLYWVHETDLKHRAEWEARLHAELTHLPEAVRTQRMEMVLDLCMTRCASLEAQLEMHGGAVDVAFASTALIEAVAAILTAPDSTRQYSTQKQRSIQGGSHGGSGHRNDVGSRDTDERSGENGAILSGSHGRKALRRSVARRAPQGR